MEEGERSSTGNDKIHRSFSTPDMKFIDPNTQENLEDLSVGQLKSRLRSVNLPIYGCKRTLCQRLMMTNSPSKGSFLAGSRASTVSQSTYPLFESPLQRSGDVGVSDTNERAMNKLRLTELRQKCKDFNLPSAGRKQELIDRLKSFGQTRSDEPEFSAKVEPEVEVSRLTQDDEFFEWASDFNEPSFPTQPLNLPKTGLSISRDQFATDSFLPFDSNNPRLPARSVLTDPLEVSDSGWQSQFGNIRGANSVSFPIEKGFDDLEQFTSMQLKNICKAFGISIAGKKDELISRILDNNNSHLFANNPELQSRFRKKIRREALGQFHSSQPVLSNSFSRNLVPLAPKVDDQRSSREDNETEKDLKKRTTRAAAVVNCGIEEVLSSRFYLLQEKILENNREWMCAIEEEFSSSQVYNVIISQNPVCDCEAFSSRGIACKHILYVFLRVLRFETQDSRISKAKLTQSEISDVFARVKAIQALRSNRSLQAAEAPIMDPTSPDEHREVEVFRENWINYKSCGICYEPLTSTEHMIWCRVKCGKNVHQTCFEKWSRFNQNPELTCPYCLSTWKSIPKNTRYQSKLKRSRPDQSDP